MKFRTFPLGTYAGALISLFLTLAMIYYPKDVFDSAMIGLNLWWSVVFPSLLPFFILSEILMGIGIVHFIGVLLEPLMRPLFNVPGIGAFALSLGLASGYPMDAVITSNFRKNNLCTAIEAERLLSFTNTADPLFMFGAVAVGMFGMPELGATLAIAHYGGSLLVGLLFRFHGRSRDESHTLPLTAVSARLLPRALSALVKARREDNRPFGKLLGDAVRESMQTSLLIGGFIILFSVFLRILSTVGVTDCLAALFGSLLFLINFDTASAHALVSGLFEIDLGALAVSESSSPLIEKITLVSAIIAWSGLSVHGQVASIVMEAGISMKPYMIARLLHAILAGLLAYLLFDPLRFALETTAIPVFQSHDTSFDWLMRIEHIATILLLLLTALLTLSLICALATKCYYNIKKQ
ncbi:MAG: sporulation integral membrane protein YlbJ [Selenomonadales bacterium]|nr:sporulation integral membrane protein YlbJ [Selenomonadales bacterium]